jgi:hypothetical protein
VAQPPNHCMQPTPQPVIAERLDKEAKRRHTSDPARWCSNNLNGCLTQGSSRTMRISPRPSRQSSRGWHSAVVPEARHPAAQSVSPTYLGPATLASAIEAFQGTIGFMPAKGGCVDLFDAEISAAVDYMVEQVQR